VVFLANARGEPPADLQRELKGTGTLQHRDNTGKGIIMVFGEKHCGLPDRVRRV